MDVDLPHKILHIDDDFILRELIEAIFHGLDGFTLKNAENGNEALSVLSSFKPDLILLDLSMPELDGAAFLQKIKSLEGVKDTPVIIITQFENIKMTGDYDRLSVIGVIHKPVDPEDVFKTIRDLWQARPQ